jgi:UbiD family decarboxylase
MIQGRNRTSIHLTLAKHLWEFQRYAEAEGKPLPVAFAIGVHPAIALGCLAIGSIDEDERAIMGGFAG